MEPVPVLLVSIKASEVKAIESVARNSFSVLSYIEHFDVASTKLLHQAALGGSEPEQSGVWSTGAQMVLNFEPSQMRVVSHLTNIEAKILGNMVSARRDSFLARSNVTGDQQPNNYLRTTSIKSHLWLRSCQSARDDS